MMTDKTPKPVDPEDTEALYQVFFDVVGSMAAVGVRDVLPVVARAVLPEGYVAVPVALIQEGIRVMEEYREMILELLHRSLNPEAGEE
jgi:hypothetical protein